MSNGFNIEIGLVRTTHRGYGGFDSSHVKLSQITCMMSHTCDAHIMDDPIIVRKTIPLLQAINCAIVYILVNKFLLLQLMSCDITHAIWDNAQYN